MGLINELYVHIASEILVLVRSYQKLKSSNARNRPKDGSLLCIPERETC